MPLDTRPRVKAIEGQVLKGIRYSLRLCLCFSQTFTDIEVSGIY